MSLDATVRVRLGEFHLDVALGAPSGAVTAVVGPNGAGKTTLLRAISGALGIDSGSIVLDGVVLDEPPGVFVAPQRRRLGIVHQDYLLFPHLTALDNVAFGPRSSGRSTARARAVAAELLARFGVGDLARLKPADLSGGQAQRVALARALATEPDALLLDEPLAALDATTRVEVRRDLRRIVAGFAGPVVLVAHDPIDVVALAERVAVIESGRLTQEGTLREVASRPRSRYVAELFGTNLLTGAVAGDTLVTDAGATLIVAEQPSGAVFATIAPSAVALHRNEPEGSPRNRWATTVRHIDVVGDRLRVQLASPIEIVAEITSAAGAELGLREGESVWASVKATEIRTSPR